MAVSLRLGLDICEPHSCRCGLLIVARGLHSLTCKQAPVRSSRHHTLNDLVAQALAVAGVPAVKEPAGLVTRILRDLGRDSCLFDGRLLH